MLRQAQHDIPNTICYNKLKTMVKSIVINRLLNLWLLNWGMLRQAQH